MTKHAIAPEVLNDTVASALGELVQHIDVARGEVTVSVSAGEYHQVMRLLRDAAGCRFEQLIDLCGVDYSTYGDGRWEGPRFAVVVHLLSVSLNQRLRVRVFCTDDEFPVIRSVTDLWSGADWFEREAFDLYGIVFEGHADLRRILTDYGFDGHPLRKDFPLTGFVELRYDEELKRVAYGPVQLTQEFRDFDYMSPWEAMTTLPGDEKVHLNRLEGPA